MRYKKEKNYWQQDIHKRDYLAIILQGLALTLLLSYVFYDSLWGVIPLSPIFFVFFRIRKASIIKKKQSDFRLQFKDAIHAISDALNVGYSVENAIREARKELEILYKKEEPVLREFRYMIRQLDMNLTAESVLLEFAVRTGDEEVWTFATVFGVAKRSGGDMIAMIHTAVGRITEQVELLGEMETLIAAKKLEFHIMTAIPICMLCYMRLSFPGLLQVLYGNIFGIVLMSVCLLVYLLAYLAGRHIVEVEV